MVEAGEHWGHMMLGGSIGRGNVISWGNPAVEPGGSNLVVTEPPPHPSSPHAGPGFVPRWAAALSSLSLSCDPGLWKRFGTRGRGKMGIFPRSREG